MNLTTIFNWSFRYEKWDNSSNIKYDAGSLPSVSFAWSAYDGNDYEVYKWESGKVIQITDNQSDDLHAQYCINSGNIIWLNIPFLTLFCNNGTVDTLSSNYYSLKISSDVIAWEELGTNPAQVFVHFNGQIQQLSDGSYLGSNIKLYDSRLVWISSTATNNGDTKIMLWQNGIFEQVPETGIKNRSIAINDRFLSWLSSGDGSDYDVYAYYNGIVKALSFNDENSESAPLCAGNSVAWIELDSSGRNYVVVSDFKETKNIYSSDSTLYLYDNGSDYVIVKEHIDNNLTRTIAFNNNTMIPLDTGIIELYGKGERLFWIKIYQNTFLIRYFNGTSIADIIQKEKTGDLGFYGMRFDSGSYGFFGDFIMWYEVKANEIKQVYLCDFKSIYELGAGVINKMGEPVILNNLSL